MKKREIEKQRVQIVDPEQHEREVLCDACGKSLRFGNASMIAVSVCYSVDANVSKNLQDDMQRLTFPYETDRSYNICNGCFLKSLGIRPYSDTLLVMDDGGMNYGITQPNSVFVVKGE